MVQYTCRSRLIHWNKKNYRLVQVLFIRSASLMTLSDLDQLVDMNQVKAINDETSFLHALKIFCIQKQAIIQICRSWISFLQSLLQQIKRSETFLHTRKPIHGNILLTSTNLKSFLYFLLFFFCKSFIFFLLLRSFTYTDYFQFKILRTNLEILRQNFIFWVYHNLFITRLASKLNLC